MTVVDQTYKLMNINYGGTVDQLNPGCQNQIPTSTQNVNPNLGCLPSPPGQKKNINIKQ